MISKDVWAFALPVYMDLIRYGMPALGVLLLIVLAYLWFRCVYNKIFEVLHPDADIRTQKTNTWYIPKEEREKEHFNALKLRSETGEGGS